MLAAAKPEGPRCCRAQRQSRRCHQQSLPGGCSPKAVLLQPVRSAQIRKPRNKQMMLPAVQTRKHCMPLPRPPPRPRPPPLSPPPSRPPLPTTRSRRPKATPPLLAPPQRNTPAWHQAWPAPVAQIKSRGRIRKPACAPDLARSMARQSTSPAPTARRLRPSAPGAAAL